MTLLYVIAIAAPALAIGFGGGWWLATALCDTLDDLSDAKKAFQEGYDEGYSVGFDCGLDFRDDEQESDR